MVLDWKDLNRRRRCDMLSFARDGSRVWRRRFRWLDRQGREEQCAGDERHQRQLQRVLFTFSRFKVALDLTRDKPFLYIVGHAVSELERVADIARIRPPAERRADCDRHVNCLAQVDAILGCFDVDEVQDLRSKGRLLGHTSCEIAEPCGLDAH